jgi:hypothetical protein
MLGLLVLQYHLNSSAVELELALSKLLLVSHLADFNIIIRQIRLDFDRSSNSNSNSNNIKVQSIANIVNRSLCSNELLEVITA